MWPLVPAPAPARRRRLPPPASRQACASPRHSPASRLHRCSPPPSCWAAAVVLCGRCSGAAQHTAATTCRQRAPLAHTATPLLPSANGPQVDTAKLGAGMAEALNKELAPQGLTATVTATATDAAPSSGARRLQQQQQQQQPVDYGGSPAPAPAALVVYMPRARPARQQRDHRGNRVQLRRHQDRHRFCRDGRAAQGARGGLRGGARGGRSSLGAPGRAWVAAPPPGHAAAASGQHVRRPAPPHAQISVPVDVLASLGDLAKLVSSIIRSTAAIGGGSPLPSPSPVAAPGGYGSPSPSPASSSPSPAAAASPSPASSPPVPSPPPAFVPPNGSCPNYR